MAIDGAPLTDAVALEGIPASRYAEEILGPLEEETYTPPGHVHGALNWVSRFLHTQFGIFSLVLILLLTFMAILAPVLAPYDPSAIAGPALAPPFGHFVFGTDAIGSDVLSNFIYGAQVSLLVGAASGLIALVLGCVFGGLAGYLGGFVDAVLMRIAELFMVIPTLILAVVAVALIGENLLYIIVIIALSLWPQEARIARSQFLTLRERDFVQGARVHGFRWPHIVFKEILPNAIAPVIVQVSLDAGSAILLYAGLCFLGLGDPALPSWGTMLTNAQSYLTADPWLSVFPGVGILVAVLAFNFLGHALNEVMNPRIPRVSALAMGRRMATRLVAPSTLMAPSTLAPTTLITPPTASGSDPREVPGL